MLDNFATRSDIWQKPCGGQVFTFVEIFPEIENCGGMIWSVGAGKIERLGDNVM